MFNALTHHQLKKALPMTTLNTLNNTATLAQVQLQQVTEQLKQDDSILLQAYSEYASNNGYDSVYDNDEENINMMFADSHDAIRAAFYGDYNPSHTYFTFNGYGNLQSFEYLDCDNSPIDIEELAQWIVKNDLFNEYNLEVATLDDMLASIEDNISDDKYILSKLADYLGESLHTEQVEQLKTDDDYYDYLVSHFMNEISDYSYNDLYDLINTVSINYSVN